MTQILLLNENGDDAIATYDRLDEASVKAAIDTLEKEFDKGRTAYSVEGDERVILRRGELPENAEKIIVVPQMQGG